MNNTRFFIMRSETQAIKAKKLLSMYGIAASVNKVTSEAGCSFGISFSEKDYSLAVSLLNGNSIPFSIASSHK